MPLLETIEPRIVALLCLLLLPACERAGEVTEGSPALVRASMSSLAFVPTTIEASVGDTVVWQNDDLVPHTVDAVDDSWTSGQLNPTQEFRHVVREPGRIALKCRYHPSMQGVIIARSP